MSWLALELYKRGMIKIGKFKLTSGFESPFYIDLRQLYSHVELTEKLIRELCTIIDPSKFDVVVGIATSGLVLASLMAYELRKPLAYVRSERKHHGTQALVEGVVTSRRCLIVDDVATTGGSIESAYKALTEVGGIPVAVVVVVDREQGARKRVENLGMEFYSYIRASEIFKHLYESRLIDENQYNEVMKYIRSFGT